MAAGPFGKFDDFATFDIGKAFMERFAEKLGEKFGEAVKVAGFLVFFEERIVVLLAVFGENCNRRVAELTELKVRQETVGATVAVVERMDILETGMELGDFVEEVGLGIVVAVKNVVDHRPDVLRGGSDMPADTNMLAAVAEATGDVIIDAGD